jgi:hypothetical protein
VYRVVEDSVLQGLGPAASWETVSSSVVESVISAELALGQARLTKEPASASGPPFMILFGIESSEAGTLSVVRSPPSEPFLYLSLDSQPQEGVPFP